MATKSKADWLIPTGLIVLSLVPALAGSVRLTQVLGSAEITPENARFLTAPVSTVLHIAAVTVFSMLGAFQFSPGFRKRKPGWHRLSGRVVLVAGLVAALTGLWMAHSYEWPRFDGYYLYGIRLVVGTAMAVSLVRAFTTVLRRDFTTHRAMMIRAYALGLGAGTQVFTHIPYFLMPDIQGELSRTIFMGAGWAINWVVAEWIIARGRRRESADANGLFFGHHDRNLHPTAG